MFVYYLYITKYFVYIVITRLYEIFPQEQIDVGVFLKNQNDTAPKSQRFNYYLLYIPKLISASLLRILELRNELNINDITLYKTLNGGFEVSDEKYAQISNIMLEINENNWESLKQIKDIIIISELLFIWMDECVKCCISPKSINEIFKEEGGEEFSNNITEYLLDHSNQTQEEIQLLNSYIKKHMKKYEYEIVKYYALFLKEIFPISNNINNQIQQNVIVEYEHMTEKFAIFLLGYNIDTLFEREYQICSKSSFENSNINIFDTVQNLIILLEFFQGTTRTTLTEENKYNILNEEVTTQLNKQKMMGSHWSAEHSPRFSGEGMFGKKNDMSLNYGGVKMTHFNSKEKKLYDIYTMLREHFKIKEEGVSQKDSDTELRNKIDNLAKVIKHTSGVDHTVTEEDRESSDNKNEVIHHSQPNKFDTDNNIYHSEQEIIEQRKHFPSEDVNKIKKYSFKMQTHEDNVKNKCSSVDWFKKKRQSKGVYILDKKRATNVLKYQFSLRRNNGVRIKSRLDSKKDFKDIMKKPGMFEHIKTQTKNNDSMLRESNEHNNQRNLLKINYNTNNNPFVRAITPVVPHSYSQI